MSITHPTETATAVATPDPGWSWSTALRPPVPGDAHTLRADVIEVDGEPLAAIRVDWTHGDHSGTGTVWQGDPVELGCVIRGLLELHQELCRMRDGGAA
jgi:hypothetical protein